MVSRDRVRCAIPRGEIMSFPGSICTSHPLPSPPQKNTLEESTSTGIHRHWGNTEGLRTLPSVPESCGHISWHHAEEKSPCHDSLFVIHVCEAGVKHACSDRRRLPQGASVTVLPALISCRMNWLRGQVLGLAANHVSRAGQKLDRIHDFSSRRDASNS